MTIERKYIYLIIGMLLGGISILSIDFIVNQNEPWIAVNENKASDSSVMDAHFIEQMIPHHEDAITMSKIALEKSQKPEVRELAENIISSQQKEIDQMNEWYKDWYGRDLPTGNEVMMYHGMMTGSKMHMGISGSTQDIDNLENAENFDKAFLEHMIPHHQMAVMMASMLKDGSTRPELKKMADDIVSAQTIEIDLMRKWLLEWD